MSINSSLFEDTRFYLLEERREKLVSPRPCQPDIQHPTQSRKRMRAKKARDFSASNRHTRVLYIF